MNARSRTVALVCDADPSFGLGHLSRMVALAEAVADEGATASIVGRVAAPFAPLAEAAGIEIVPMASFLGEPGAVGERTAALARLGAEVVAIDSYQVDEADLAALASGRRSCCIDDFGRLGSYPTDLVVNFTVAAPTLGYPPDHPGLLLGPAWFLARRALRQARVDHTAQLPPGPAQRVLVAIGGADATGTTPRVAAALVDLAPGLMVDVVLGRPTPDLDRLHELVSTAAPGSAVTVGVPSLAPHLAAADLVVCGGGLTKYEGAYLGRPVLIIDQTHDQAGDSVTFTAAGLARTLGVAGDLDDHALRSGLGELLADDVGRATMARTARDAFPDDPTANVARRLLAAP